MQENQPQANQKKDADLLWLKEKKLRKLPKKQPSACF